MKATRSMLVLVAVGTLMAACFPRTATADNSAWLLRTPLAPAVVDVLKLSQAGISEPVIFSFIETSGHQYDLKPEHLIYLKNEGVSDNVINKMMEQSRALQAATPAPAPEPPVAPIAMGPDYTFSDCPLFCGVCGNPLVNYLGPISTLYVIPYPTPPSRATYTTYSSWSPYYYFSSWQRPFLGPGFYPCGHWHGGGNHRHWR